MYYEFLRNSQELKGVPSEFLGCWAGITRDHEESRAAPRHSLGSSDRGSPGRGGSLQAALRLARWPPQVDFHWSRSSGSTFYQGLYCYYDY